MSCLFIKCAAGDAKRSNYFAKILGFKNLINPRKIPKRLNTT